MVEGKQVNGEPYEVDENGREKKKIEPVDKKAELKEVTFKILV